MLRTFLPSAQDREQDYLRMIAFLVDQLGGGVVVNLDELLAFDSAQVYVERDSSLSRVTIRVEKREQV